MEEPNYITNEDVVKYLRYEPDTGNFYWIADTNPRGPSKVGQTAGCKNVQGYWQIGLLGVRLLGHRLAWLYVHGYAPWEIDHINGVKSDNRIINLREVTRSQNNANFNKLKRGVFLEPTGKFLAYITSNYVRTYLGRYDTREEAQLAYNVAADKTFGEFARINRE